MRLWSAVDTGPPHVFNYATMFTAMIHPLYRSSVHSAARYSLLCSIALAAILASPVRAQDGEKYGFVNISQVITQTDEGLAEAKELETLGAAKQQELNARRQELEELAARYEKAVEDGSPDSELRDRIKRMQRELERDVRQAQADVDVSRQDRIQALGSKIVTVIQQFARDNNYTAIFRIDNGQVIYVDPGVDITEQIITAYNEAHPAEE